jgi:pimeloyl-ACP methyl ester carboxylesterase
MTSVANGTNNKLTIIFCSLSLIITCLYLSVSGCALVKVKKEVHESMESAAIAGVVSTAFPKNGPIIVVAYSINQGKRVIAHYVVLHAAGEYELLVDKGKYHIFAFWDKNSNLIYEKGEPAGQYGDTTTLVSAPAGSVVGEAIDFTIPEDGETVDAPVGLEISANKPLDLHSRLAGTITNLDNKLFSEEYGRKGYWEPITFFKEVGGTIFFLEEYDPDKIPILFIHGATGTPSGWNYFVNNIDRTRFQPWLFYYPSGARINSMAYLLAWKLDNLYSKYKFDKIYFTAHSLGGLVARSYLMNFKSPFFNVELFVALATPWGGDPMAQYGVEHSPGVIPCWIDMQPDSEFMKSLYRANIPEDVSFYMFYGYNGSRNPFRSINDGTLTFSSLLDRRAQSEAKMNYAFNEDHASIIYSEAVLDQYNSIINTFYERKGSERHRSGGYLEIELRNLPPNKVYSLGQLLLRPIEDNRSDIVVNFMPDESSITLGPFSVGEYRATVLVVGARPDKTNVPINIEKDKTNKESFVFTPEGMIRGWVTIQNPVDRVAGMPPKIVPPEKGVNLQSIAINGKGMHRRIYPFKGDKDDVADLVLSGSDFIYNDRYIIFGLHAGEYEIEINVQGYEPKTVKHIVTPGQAQPFLITELTPP